MKHIIKLAKEVAGLNSEEQSLFNALVKEFAVEEPAADKPKAKKKAKKKKVTKVRSCSVCKEEGHNARSCPHKEEEPEPEPEAPPVPEDPLS